MAKRTYRQPHTQLCMITGAHIHTHTCTQTYNRQCTVKFRGDLAVAIADMDIFHQLITPSAVQNFTQQIKDAKMVVADGNLSEDAMKVLGDICSSMRRVLFFEPTSDHKCLLPLQAGVIHEVQPPTHSFVHSFIHLFTHTLFTFHCLTLLSRVD